MKNDFRVVGDVVFIKVMYRGEYLETLVSRSKLAKLLNFDVTWYVFKDSKSPTLYIRCNYRDVDGNKKQIQLHRFVTGAPKGLVVDHIQVGLTLDNRDENLRVVTQAVNCQNKKGASKNSKTGVLGVCYNEKTGKYQAQIGVNGTNIALGTYANIEDAIAARKQAEEVYYDRTHKGAWIPTVDYNKIWFDKSEYTDNTVEMGDKQ